MYAYTCSLDPIRSRTSDFAFCRSVPFTFGETGTNNLIVVENSKFGQAFLPGDHNIVIEHEVCLDNFLLYSDRCREHSSRADVVCFPASLLFAERNLENLRGPTLRT